MPEERLQKLLAQHGLASRRQAEQWIQSGRVTVNGETAQLGQKANLDWDQVAVDRVILSVRNQPRHQYLLFHKPPGMVCTCFDPEGRPTVIEALGDQFEGLGLHPVGRLDVYSTGALILTNDGNFTYRLTHPKHDVAKTYQVTLERPPTEQTLERWRQGVYLDDYLTRPAKVIRVNGNHEQDRQLLITLWEGRNRQIRRVAELLGHRVLSLHRLAIGSVHLGSLKRGAFRQLSPAEMGNLLAGSTDQS
ncbi:MAG: rRNA pseudouridine synthase [Cyanobacteria bacterium REEB459]|nr:rRNA pseudouridine synthase [Cyanobacteria bacterium REEB459]